MVGAKRSIGLWGVLETFATAQTRPGTLRSGTGVVRTLTSGLVRDRSAYERSVWVLQLPVPFSFPPFSLPDAVERTAVFSLVPYSDVRIHMNATTATAPGPPYSKYWWISKRAFSTDLIESSGGHLQSGRR